MSATGRIFVVLNLILSAAFLGWASNALQTADDFKGDLADEQAAHQATRSASEEEISGLNIQLNTLRDDQRKFIGERDGLKTERDALQGQLDEEKRTNGQMRAQLAEIASTLGDYRDSIAQLGREKDAAVERAHAAENERDDATQAAQDAELERRNAEEARGRAEERIDELTQEIENLRSQLSATSSRLEAVVAKYNIPSEDLAAVPQIEAAVLEVRRDIPPGLVMLNVGQSAGVKRGYTFHVYRGGTYKGQVRVEGVEGENCSAIPVGGDLGATIQQGDSATTRL